MHTHTRAHTVKKFNVSRAELSGQIQSSPLNQNVWWEPKTRPNNRKSQRNCWEQQPSHNPMLHWSKGAGLCVFVCDVPSCIYVDKSSVKSITVVMSVTFWEAVCWSDCSHGLVRPKLTSPAMHSNKTANRKSPLLMRSRHFQNKSPLFKGNHGHFLHLTSTGTMVNRNLFYYVVMSFTSIMMSWRCCWPAMYIRQYISQCNLFIKYGIKCATGSSLDSHKTAAPCWWTTAFVRCTWRTPEPYL